MLTLNCETFRNFSGNIEKILLFGLTHQVKPYTEQAAKQAINNGLCFYCNAKDNEGNIYKLFSDYDPALTITKTIAFKVINTMDIIKIIVTLSNNSKNIEYCVDTRQERQVYNDKTIPGNIVELMNKTTQNNIVYHEKDPAAGTETLVYSFLK